MADTGIFEGIIEENLPDLNMRGVAENMNAGDVHMITDVHMTSEQEQGPAAERAAEKAEIAALVKDVDALDEKAVHQIKTSLTLLAKRPRAEDEELLELYLEMVLRQREEPPADPLMRPSEDLSLPFDSFERMLGLPAALRLGVLPTAPMFHLINCALYPDCNIVLGPNFLQPRFVIMQGGRAVAGDTGVSMMILLALWPEEHGTFLRANSTALMSYPFKTLRYDPVTKAWMRVEKSIADGNLVGVSRQHQGDLTRPPTFHLKVASGAASTGPVPVRLHDKALSRNISGNGTKLAFLILPELPAERARHPCLALLGQPFVSILRVNH